MEQGYAYWTNHIQWSAWVYFHQGNSLPTNHFIWSSRALHDHQFWYCPSSFSHWDNNHPCHSPMYCQYHYFHLVSIVHIDYGFECLLIQFSHPFHSFTVKIWRSRNTMHGMALPDGLLWHEISEELEKANIRCIEDETPLWQSSDYHCKQYLCDHHCGHFQTHKSSARLWGVQHHSQYHTRLDFWDHY